MQPTLLGERCLQEVAGDIVAEDDKRAENVSRHQVFHYFHQDGGVLADQLQPVENLPNHY